MCVCWCEDLKAGSKIDFQLPSISASQLDNSIKAEAYFRSKGSQVEINVANLLEAIRKAHQAKDIDKYIQLSQEESTWTQHLSRSQWQQWEEWKMQHLSFE